MEWDIPEWVLGAMICLFGSTLTALGLVLQKLAHTVSELAGNRVHGYLMQKWWILGFLIFLCAQIINVVSMAMTPQLVLSCLGSWTLVCNAVFARLILREALSPWQLLSLLCLIVAMVMIIYNSPKPSDREALETGSTIGLAKRFLSPAVEVMTMCFIGLVLLLRTLAMGLQRDCSLDSPTALPGAVLSIAGGAGAGAGRCQPRLWTPLSWTVMAAVAVGYTGLLFKCIAEMIAYAAVASTPPWCYWEAYVILVVALSLLPTGLHCLNLALQSGDAGLVVPMYLTLGMISQLTTGAVFFRELDGFNSALHASGFACGVTLTLVSVAVMAKLQGDRNSNLGKTDFAPDLLEKLDPEAAAGLSASLAA